MKTDMRVPSCEEVFRPFAWVALVLCLLAGAAQPTLAQQPPTEQQDEFVPVSELPPEERLPAAPLLVGAYAFVVLTLFVYLVSVSRRLTAVKADIARLESDLKRTAR